MNVLGVVINGLIESTVRMDLFQKGVLNASGGIGMKEKPKRLVLKKMA
jgi:hypothetical protein